MIFGDKAVLNYTTEEEAQAAVDAATSACTGDRKLVHKKRSHAQVAAASAAAQAATNDNGAAAAAATGPAPKKQRAKRVARCNNCHTCLNRKLRKPCKCVPVVVSTFTITPLRTALPRHVPWRGVYDGLLRLLTTRHVRTVLAKYTHVT